MKLTRRGEILAAIAEITLALALVALGVIALRMARQ